MLTAKGSGATQKALCWWCFINTGVTKQTALLRITSHANNLSTKENNMENKIIEVQEKELRIFIIYYTRWVLKSKTYQTSQWVKILKKHWVNLDKETQKILKTEIKGRIKHLKNTHLNPSELHYFKSYHEFIDWLEKKESEYVKH